MKNLKKSINENTLRQMIRDTIDEVLNEGMKRYKTTLIKDVVNSRKGISMKRGETVTLDWNEKAPSFTYIYNNANERVMVFTINLHKYVKGIKKTPSNKALEKMVMDGVAKTVLGKRTEPDGYDEYGSPSWLLIMGVI